MSITKIEHARVLKKLNIPLNTPVREEVFSEKHCRHWSGLMEAHAGFMWAVVGFARSPSPRQWRRIKSKLTALKGSMTACDGFLAELLGGAELTRVQDGSATRQDQHEGQIMANFIVERGVPYIRYWERAIAAVDRGAELAIKTSDIPPWTDEE